MPLPSVPVLPSRSALPGAVLQGLTLLAVEDSRFTCEALRLLCQRSGARLRRAETLAAAQAHLHGYRPDVVLIDLGLPDGRGEGLIRDLALRPARPAVLGLSGDPAGHAFALAAGADGFLEKPITGLRGFQSTILRLLVGRPLEDVAATDSLPPPPDPLALRDDLGHAARLLSQDAGRALPYVARFVQGIARAAADPVLEEAARAAAGTGAAAGELAALLALRLAASRDHFTSAQSP